MHFGLRSNGTSHLCKLKDCPDQHRKLSFTQEPDNEPARNFNVGNLLLHSDVLGNQISEEFVIEPNATCNVVVPLDPVADKPELTCISEEGIADMDLPDNIFDDFDYIGDCITSCNKVKFCHFFSLECFLLQWKISDGIIAFFFNFSILKVEQYLMLSEFEANINAELPVIAKKRDCRHTVEDET